MGTAHKAQVEELFKTYLAKFQAEAAKTPEIMEERFPYLVARLRSMDAGARDKWALIADKASTAKAVVVAKTQEVRANPQEALALAQAEALKQWLQVLNYIQSLRKEQVVTEPFVVEEPAVEEEAAPSQVNYSTADEAPEAEAEEDEM